MATFDGIIADTQAAAIAAWLDQHRDIDGNLPPLAAVKARALAVVRGEARERAAAVDQLVSGHPTLATEVVIYFQAGRPADPNPAIYVIAAALASRRGADLRATLEGLLTRWRNVQAAVAGLVTELDRVEGEIQNASDIAGVQDTLAGLVW